jgi:hypothetical protein
MSSRPCATLLLAFVSATSASAGDVVPFTSEHAARGVIYNMMLAPPIVNPQDGFGMALADLDGDGDLDLVLLGRADGLVGIFENQGAGTFINRSTGSGIPATVSGCGVSAFDYDRDGDLDIFIAQKNLPCRLLRNNGGLRFTDVATAAGIDAVVPAAGTSVADFDGDGWLDLSLCVYSTSVRNRLFRNRGDGTFEDVAPALGVDSPGLSYQSVWSDYDRDSWPDLCVSNDRGFAAIPNQLWRNDEGAFADVSAASGMDVSLCSMGIACADLDGDLRSDYYFTNLPDLQPPLLGVNPLLLSSKSGAFTQAQAAWGVEHRKFSWAAIFWDFDNDADLDLYVNNESLPNTLYRNAGAPPMTDIAAAAAITGTAPTSYVSAVGDLDGDGDLDLVQNNYAGAVRLYMNNEGSQRAWVRLRVAGEGRVRDAIGASATLVSRAKTGQASHAQWREVLCGGNGYLGQNETTLHFGLGSDTAVSSVEVRWPADGPVRTLTNVPLRASWTAYPPSRLGDVDGDGTVALADWTQFVQWGTGAVASGREMLDFDGDFDLDAADVAAFWQRATLRRGDLDGDGSVLADDLAALLGAWGQSGATGDLDLDGSVGASDLAVLLGSWGT